MTTKFGPFQLKLKLLLPLAFSILLLVTVYYWLHSRLLQETTHENAITTFHLVQNAYNAEIKSEATTLYEPLEFIVRDPQIQDAILNQNRQALQALAMPIYQRLQQHNNVTHFYFIRPNRTVLLRIHQPARRDDLIDRHTLIEAKKTGKPSFGVELGPLGTFTLRVVFPCVVNGQLIGYVELGKEVNYLIHDLERTFHLKSVVLLDKHFLSQEDWKSGKATFYPNTKWDNLPNHVLVMESLPLGNRVTELLPYLDHEEAAVFHNFKFGGLYYHISSMPLMDAGKGQIGSALLFMDITHERRKVKQDAIKLAIGFLIIGGGVFLIYYLILNRTEQKLANETQARAQNLQDLEKAYSRLKKAQKISRMGDWIYTIASNKLNWSEEARIICDVHTPITPLDDFLVRIHPDDRPAMEQAIQSAINFGPIHNLTYRIRLPNGKEKYFEHHMEVEHDASGTPLTLAWTGRDVTEQKLAELKLQELNRTLEERVAEETRKNIEHERMLTLQGRHAAMGQMIGNIAHQWRQPLTVLGLLIQNLYYDFKGGELTEKELKEYVDKGLRTIERMTTTIDDFRNFFKPSLQAEEFIILKPIEDCLSLIGASLKHNNIEVSITGAQDIKLIGYPNDFSQIMLNLITNAKDAILERKITAGRIDIAVASTGHGVVVSVRDNAGGIVPENLEKIFDPYFTTKESGTGIGLHMVRTIVEQHMHGTITAQNSEEGALFRISLPTDT